MITVYERTDCPFCWKLRIALAELSIDYHRVAIQLGDINPDVNALSPKGSVPVVVDGNTIIWESSVAIEYINEQYGAGRLLPGAAAQRSSVRLLHTYSDSVVGPALRGLVFEKRSKPQSQWDWEKILQSQSQWQQCLDKLELWLDGRDYFSTAFSIAECALLPRFGIAKAYDAGVDHKHPGLQQWFERNQQRPGYLISYPVSFIGLQ